MRLLRLQVENFGVLQNYRLELTDGLNVLHEKNGWGKSTLAVFIKAMLYGLPATSKRSLDENERKKYNPWQGGAYGGSLEFACAKGRFRIERFFGEKEAGDRFSLFDLSTNKPSDAFSENVGEELFGIDADGFERSTYLSQRVGFGRSENTTIRAKLGDLLEDVNDMGNYDVAIDALDKRRKFYQMTGNRGAIAEEQKKILDLRAELEACNRTDTVAAQKKEEQKAVAEQITAAEGEERALRAMRERVMRAREHAAQLEEKGRMLDGLSELEAKKKQTEAIFCGFIPTEEELNAAHQTLDELREMGAALRAIPDRLPDAEELESLSEFFGEKPPRREDLDVHLSGCEKLRRMRDTQKRLTDDIAAIKQDIRFASGVPTPEDFEAAFSALEQSKKIQDEIERTKLEAAHTQESVKKAKRVRLGASIAVCAVGAILAGVSFVLGGALLMPLLIAGGVLAVVGAILAIVFSRSNAAQREEARAKRALATKQAVHEAAIAQVVQLLERCGTAAEGDLARLLTEVSLAAVQARENVHRRRALREQLGEIGRTAEQVRARLAAYVARFDKEATEEDYAQTLSAVQRDLERYHFLCREETRRAAQKTNAMERQEALRAELRPFIKRYDSTNSKTATEIIDSVSEAYTTYRRLSEEYKKRESALRAFIVEKKLDERAVEDDVMSAEELERQERALQARLGELRDRHTRLGMELARLSEETDRLPELEASLNAAEERHRLYTKNFKTVTATANFLSEAKEALSTRYLSGMQESFDRYLGILTEGEDAPASTIDSSFDVRVRAHGQSRTMESFSRGRRDAVRFCVRLSLTDELYKDSEKPFLLLDDPFVNLDEDALCEARHLLDTLASKYQIIHMICHEGRA